MRVDLEDFVVIVSLCEFSPLPLRLHQTVKLLK